MNSPTRRAESLAPGQPPSFEAVAQAFANDPRTVRAGGKGFGSGALKVDGKIFAMISSKGYFVVKLPERRVTELIRLGIGEHFRLGPRRGMREWVALDGRPELWLQLATEARGFVGNQ